MRPASACASVPPSTYSNSPPTGTPCAMRDAFRPSAQREFAQIVRGGLALRSRIGGENHFANLAVAEQPLEVIQAEFGRPHAVERRQMPHEHEVAAAKSARLFDGHHIGGRLDHAQLRHVALGRGADRAKFALRQHAAALAMPDVVERFGQAPGSSALPPSRSRSSR